MNQGDEIVFSDVAYRQPRRTRRPDRDPALACVTCGVAEAGQLAVFLDLDAADLIERHALSNTNVELGGILLGWECIDPETGEPFVWITKALEARNYTSTQASFTYTHDSWEEITRERDRLHPDLDIVGWYHTHPDFGIFLSSHDLFIHHHFFAQPLQTAYVVDPIRQARGFFQWRDERVEPVGGFHVTAARTRRPALAQFVHELENLPADESGAVVSLGGLSPRLEARLIEMLSRPHTVAPAGTSSAMAGSVFGLLGLVLGMLALAAGLWLSSLNKQLETQAQAIQAIQARLEERLPNPATVRRDAKEEALDQLLKSVTVGKGAEAQPLMDAYLRVVNDRNEARAQLAALTTDKAALNTLAAKLQAERKSVDAELSRAKAQLADLKNDSDRLIEQQRDELADRNSSISGQAELVRLTRAGTLAQKYNLAWYTAAGGLVGCLVLSLGLAWALLRRVGDEEIAA